MILQILSFVSFALGVVCYSIKELQAHGKLKWQNKSGFWVVTSYDRKYAHWKRGHVVPDTWYYRFFKIKYKERFPLSATLLVFLTDGYHLMQLLFKVLFCIAIVTYSIGFEWWMGIVYFVEWGIVFTVFYKLLSR